MGAIVFTHPFAIAVFQITVLPYFHEVIFVDVPLIVVGTDTGTGSNGAVGHHGTNANACLTRIKTVAHLTLIITKETLAAIVGTDTPLLTNSPYKLEDTLELLIGQPHHRIKGSPSDREDGEQSPSGDTLRNQKFLDFIEFLIVTASDTGNNVEDEALSSDKHIDGLTHHLEAIVVASHPVVVVLQAVEADGHRVHTYL